MKEGNVVGMLLDQKFRYGIYLSTIERSKYFTGWHKCKVKKADGTWKKVKVHPDHIYPAKEKKSD